jgi:hypothetical protein
MGCIPSYFFFKIKNKKLFSTGHFDWPITKKKTLEAAQDSSFYLRMECLSFGLLMSVRKEEFWAKHMR